jgi:tetratricopeptide (TPR) repeat protein
MRVTVSSEEEAKRNAIALEDRARDLYAREKPSEALAYILESLALDAGNYSGHLLKASILIGLGRHDEAFDAVNTAIEMYPGGGDGFKRMLDAYLDGDRVDEKRERRFQGPFC